MDSQNNDPQKNQQAPSDLPVVDEKKVKIHTMQDDLKKSSGQGQTENSVTGESTSSVLSDNKTQDIPIPKPPSPSSLSSSQAKKEPSASDFSVQDKIKTEKKSSPFDRFRKPKGVKEPALEEVQKIDSLDKFKKALPKTNAEEQKNQTQTQQEEQTAQQNQEVQEQTEKPEQVSSLASSLDIKVPEKKSSSIMVVISAVALVVIAAVGGFLYYFITKNNTPKPISSPSGEQEAVPTDQPEIIPIPEPVVQEPQAPQQEQQEETVVEVPEPTIPAPLISFDQTVVTSSQVKDRNEFLKNLKADSRIIAGNGVVTRHLFKLSNDTEKRFIQNKELFDLLGLSMPDRIWQEIQKLEFISYKLDGVLRYGFVASITNKQNILSEMKAWELQAIGDLKQLYMGEPITIPESPVFSENEYLDFDKRYINLITPEISLDYAVSDKYFIVATSKDMMFATILKTQEQK